MTLPRKGDTVHLHYSEGSTAYVLARVLRRRGRRLLVHRIGRFADPITWVPLEVATHRNQLYCDRPEPAYPRPGRYPRRRPG